MICLALGLGALGFVALRKARRCRHGYYGHWHHGHGGPYGWGGPPWSSRGGMARRGLYMALSHIDASRAQERAIIAEADKVGKRIWGQVKAAGPIPIPGRPRPA